MNQPESISVSKNQYLDSIWDKLPSNAIINKGRCGIGGTTLEIETFRDSIIVVPTISIINSKCNNKDGEVNPNYKTTPKIFGVMGNVDKAELVSIFEDEHPVKKIFTTPAGLRKLMKCGYSQELIRENWFLLLDECHTAITDSFRTDILIPFDYFWDFPKKNRAMISATPYEFSDPRILEMDTIKIEIKEKLGTIEIINAKNINNCLHDIFQNPDAFKGNIHIFLNSVTEIAQVIRVAQMKKLYSIYTADSKENMVRLDELQIHYFEQPTLENVSKFNFYTSRYFEGWDLLDENPTIIIVTDLSINTTKLGIRNKAFQAIGRARTSPDRILHITNHRNIKEKLDIDEIKRRIAKRAKSVIENYNKHKTDSITNEFDTDEQLTDACKKYATFDANNSAFYNSYLVDQFINLDFCDQDYNHIDYIHDAWLYMNYETKDILYDPPEIPTGFKKFSRANKIRVIVGALELFERNKDSYLINRQSTLAKYITSVDAPEWIDAYNILGKAAIEKVEYSPTAIKELLIEDHNAKMEAQKTAMVRDLFLPGVYTIKEVTTNLYSINQKLSIKDPKGKYKSDRKEELFKYFKIRTDKSKRDRSQYEAEFGKITFTINGVKVRKLGFGVYKTGVRFLTKKPY